MVKGIACAVLVGSLAAVFACSSSSNAPLSGGNGNGSGDDASTGNTSSSGTSSSGSGSGSGSSSGNSSGGSSDGGCDVSQLGLPASCMDCVEQNCASQIASCASCDITCAATCTACASQCLGGLVGDSGASTTKDGSSSLPADAGCANPGPECTKAQNCCSTLGTGIYAQLGGTAYQPVCEEAVATCEESNCMAFLMGTVPVLNMPVSTICQ